MKATIWIAGVLVSLQFSLGALACDGKEASTKGEDSSIAKLLEPGAVALGERCMFDRECLPNERCITGVCVLPMVEPEMKLASVSSVGRTCNMTSDCSPGENCKNGVCQLAGGPGMCLNDVDCAVGERCVSGSCR